MYDGEYVWQRFFVLFPRLIKNTKITQHSKTEVYETFVWLTTIERRLNKQWIVSEMADQYEYRLLEHQKP
jgi:hypothetical protein